METDVNNTHSISGKRKNVETKRIGIFFFHLALEHRASKKDNTQAPFSVKHYISLTLHVNMCDTHSIALSAHRVVATVTTSCKFPH